MHKIYFDWLAISLFISVWQVFCPDRAFAYVDPNTGGYVFQIIFPIISAIAAVLLFFKNQAVLVIKRIGTVLKKMMGGF